MSSTHDIFKQLGLENITAQEKLQLTEELGDVALNRFAARLESMLTDEQIVEFEALMQTDESAAFDLLEKFVPNYKQIVQEEIGLLRNDMLSTHAAVMEKLKQNGKL